MDSLDGTSWDVLIAGTGIRQSLLALALSRSGKQVLHIDRNDYYGGSEAALSLQEAEAWTKKVNKDDWRSAFHNAKVIRPAEASDEPSSSKLGFPRAYSLSLAPDLLYTRSTLLPVLVSSRVHQQLEFQAVGSWFVFNLAEGSDEATRLVRVPNGREDIFADKTLNLRAKGALMKFLRFVGVYEEKPEIWQPHEDTPFPQFLSEQFNLPAASHGPLLALALSPNPPDSTTTGFALPRIARHLRSIGLFGPGFGAVIPKWGGLSEVAQVACRSGAVGGAVYVLNKSIEKLVQNEPNGSAEEQAERKTLRVSLNEGEVVTTDYVIGSAEELPAEQPAFTLGRTPSTSTVVVRSISVVSSPLGSLFPRLRKEDLTQLGLCSVCNCRTRGDVGFNLLTHAVTALLDGVGEQPAPKVLWSLRYEQRFGVPSSVATNAGPDRIMKFAEGDLDLSFDDSVVDQVKEAWRRIMGDAAVEAGEFMQFQDRQAEAGDEDEEE
ncbi:Rab proteins geranylgeranyltransferase component A [Taxawa tesnikishii (nom. ined.)]|nr:Rab proteins geranylgeranyltransferase component A [Dothideales sp. JES 119]